MSEALAPLSVPMPAEPGVAVLSVALTDRGGAVLHRNFTTFVIEGAAPDEVTLGDGRRARLARVAPAAFSDARWSLKQWNVLDGLKVDGAGSGYFEYRVPWPKDVALSDLAAATFLVEASAKQLYGKDRPDAREMSGDYMRGLGTLDPSRNPNAYPMTDQVRFPSAVTVRVNGVAAGRHELADDPADHRGILSWHSQLKDKKLREAGSYGYLVEVPIPRAALEKAAAKARWWSAWRWTRRCREGSRCTARASAAIRSTPRSSSCGSRGGRRMGVRSAMVLCVALGSAVLGAPAPSGDTARIVIDAAQVEGRIDDRLYGQFLEFMYEGVKGGLAAELLRSRGFEEAPNAIGLSRDWERYPDDRIDDYGLSFVWDDTIALPVSLDALDEKPVLHSLRVDAGGGIVERHGIYQARLPLRAGIAYQGSLWLKTTGYEGPVVIALEEDVAGGRTYAEAEVRDIQGDWKQYAFVLRPDRADTHARLAILLPGEGTAVGRPGVAPARRRRGRSSGRRRGARRRLCVPAFLRWPGGNVAQDYHWRWGVGPRDRRPLWTNLAWKNEREPGDIGTDEFVALCGASGAEPSITVNVEGRGGDGGGGRGLGRVLQRAGDVEATERCARPTATRSRCASSTGRSATRSGATGCADTPTPRPTRAMPSAIARPMRAADPIIELIATGDNDMSWNRAVLRAAAPSSTTWPSTTTTGRKEMDGDARNLMARPLYYERSIGRSVSSSTRRLRPPDPLSINEWGLDLPETRQHSMEAALYGARLMNVFERSSPLVAMTAESDLVNGWPGGIIQAGRDRLFVTPTYHVNQLYNAHRGRDRLKVIGLGPHVRHEQGGHGRARPRRRGQPLRGWLRALRQGGEHVTHDALDVDRPARRGGASGRGVALPHRAEPGHAQQLRRAGRGAASS
jgi:hypothetical protein